jgi:hypothetical protein
MLKHYVVIRTYSLFETVIRIYIKSKRGVTMGQGFFTGLSKVINVGAAYVQHVQFVELASGTPQNELCKLLQQYVQNLSEASFGGFKVTLAMLIGKEQSVERKRLIQSLLDNADTARNGNLAPTVIDDSTLSTVEQSDFDRDLQLMHKWHDINGHDQRIDALERHIIGMEIDEFKSFITNLRQMYDNVIQQKKQHEDNEDNAWGRFMEDRMAYRMARIQTGQRDPTFMRELEELQGYLNFIDWLMKTSINIMEAHAKRTTELLEREMTARDKQISTVNQTEPDFIAIREAVRTFTQSGEYPGGVDQMQIDVMLLCESDEGEEVMEMLRSMGATEGGNKILNMEEFYRPSNNLFDLRWSLGIQLPIAFDELDHATQYSVLFGEWTRRITEGSYILHQGDTEGAEKIFEECLKRAQQLEVAELIARSHEGLARVASHTGARTLERKRLEAAMTARGSF